MILASFRNFVGPDFLVFGGIALLLWLAVGYWVWRDAESRGKNGALVSLLVMFISFPVSLLLWLAFRPPIPPPATTESQFELERFRVQ